MELEFDKEMDAILRKARGGTRTSVSSSGPHLDADTIAAFADDALPQKTKLLFMEHFADCDRCRKQLSFAIQMNTEADATTASSVSEVVAEVALPWYQKLFKVQNLAFVMGALVLVFSGVLGYIVLQKGQEANNATVSQVTEQEPAKGGPYFGGEADVSNTNAAVPAANVSANMAARSSNLAVSNSIGTGMGSGGASLPAGRADAPQDKSVTTTDSGVSVGAEPPAAAMAPPPPPVTLDGVAATDDGKKDADERELKESSAELAKTKAENRSVSRRDMPPPAAKRGPARSGPVQLQSNQVNTGVFDMSVTRKVGGKSFNNRDRVWYDTAYHGQATLNYRRGTEDYKKLDTGLRNIADTLGGTVVLVWKSKAYRIQ
ncbi:MAG: hypothetical protein ABIV21_00675 [Pyrinomonadaceae bacterium]